MAQQTMYPGMIGSPTTTLTTAISGSATSFTVANGNALPEAPNLATLGSGQNAEIVLYSTKTGNTLSGVTRGFQGGAQPHEGGTLVSRRLTAYDLDALRQNHEALVAQRGAVNGVASLDATGAVPIAQLPVDILDIPLQTHLADDTSAHGINTKVSKSGDTMTGNLLITKNTPVIELKHSASGTNTDSAIVALNSEQEIWSVGRASSSGNLRIESLSGNASVFINSVSNVVRLNGSSYITGNGAPTGVISAFVGSVYLRLDGSANTTLYVKESGTGNTGWVAK